MGHELLTKVTNIYSKYYLEFTKEVCNGGRRRRLQPPPARMYGENRYSFSYCTLVCTEATIFCRKKYVTCFVSRRRLCHFSTKKDDFFYGAKLIFRSFATFFGPTMFRSSSAKHFFYYLLTPCQYLTKMQELTLQSSSLELADRVQLYYKLPYQWVLPRKVAYLFDLDYSKSQE